MSTDINSTGIIHAYNIFDDVVKSPKNTADYTISRKQQTICDAKVHLP